MTLLTKAQQIANTEASVKDAMRIKSLVVSSIALLAIAEFPGTIGFLVQSAEDDDKNSKRFTRHVVRTLPIHNRALHHGEIALRMRCRGRPR